MPVHCVQSNIYNKLICINKINLSHNNFTKQCWEIIQMLNYERQIFVY